MKQKERFRENFQNPPALAVGSFKNENHITKEDVVTIISNEQVFENPITLIWERK